MNNNKEFWIYLAGFIDGDGSIYGQILKRPDYKHKFQVKIFLVFYQKKSRSWFISQLYNELGKIGYTRERESMSELTISSRNELRKILNNLYPYLRLKRPQCKLALEVLNDLETVETRGDFLEVCKKLDKIAEHTDSKKRKITATYVADFYKKNNHL